jgi:regulator of cell morphogenesis and NO signaling
MGRKWDNMKPINDFIANYPSTRDVFEKYDIDYCCEGRKELKTALLEREISFDELKEALDKNISEYLSQDQAISKWLNYPLSELIDYIIQTHHLYLREQFGVIDKLFHTTLHNLEGNEKHPVRTIQKIYEEKIKKELLDHLDEEEAEFFPYVKHLEDFKEGRLSKRPLFKRDIMIAYVDHLLKEHFEVDEALAEIKKHTDSYTHPEAACSEACRLYKELQSMEISLREHTHLENYILFPESVKLEYSTAGKPKE